jgi:hypothetical protein
MVQNNNKISDDSDDFHDYHKKEVFKSGNYKKETIPLTNVQEVNEYNYHKSKTSSKPSVYNIICHIKGRRNKQNKEAFGASQPNKRYSYVTGKDLTFTDKEMEEQAYNHAIGRYYAEYYNRQPNYEIEEIKGDDNLWNSIYQISFNRRHYEERKLNKKE